MAISQVVFDPSAALEERWMWKNCPIDLAWNELRNLLTSHCESMPGKVFTGIAVYPDYEGRICLFRLLRGGLDAYNRPGRFILMMASVKEPAEFGDCAIHDLWRFFADQFDRGNAMEYIRLRLPDELHAAPSSSPDEAILQIKNQYSAMRSARWKLWGITWENVRQGLVSLPTVPPAFRPTPPPGEAQRRGQCPKGSLLAQTRRNLSMLAAQCGFLAPILNFPLPMPDFSRCQPEKKSSSTTEKIEAGQTAERKSVLSALSRSPVSDSIVDETMAKLALLPTVSTEERVPKVDDGKKKMDKINDLLKDHNDEENIPHE